MSQGSIFLPRIDQVVDSTAGCETLYFLDAYSGYHQIAMCIADQLATSFITPFGTYCYQTMLFGLKNAGTTLHRCIRRVFGELIGRIIEAYVDDIIVKSKKIGDLVPDLTEVFIKLQQHRVKLNPEKCVFVVPRGMLLSFVVSKHGIEANPEKISAIMDMRPVKNLKGVQHVTGCLAAQSHFIARLGEQPTAVQADEEIRALHVDPRSARGTRFSNEYAQESSDTDCSDP
jgi:hypothetical protein